MKRSTMMPRSGLVFGALLCLAASGCDDEPTGPDNMVDSGSWYRTGFEWPHDGVPFETTHFIVYSDAASQSARQRVAEIAEELLARLRDDFEIDPEAMFRWPTGQSKLHIYAYRDRFEKDWGGWGYYGGLMIYSPDHPIRDTDPESYRAVLTHELMHAIEGVLKGTDNPELVDVWVSEGIAEYVAGGTSSGNIRSVARLDSLITTWGEWNPIAMHEYDYPDIFAIGYLYYYPMFELAVRYLLHPEGLGGTELMIRDIYLDARDGAVFATSFEQRFGISLQGYEDEFWERVHPFLAVGH